MPENVKSEIIYRGANITSKRTWGQPLKIIMAIIDRRCPECDHSTHDEVRLDLGYEDGKIFGGFCRSCGWRFTMGGDWIDPCEVISG